MAVDVVVGFDDENVVGAGAPEGAAVCVRVVDLYTGFAAVVAVVVVVAGFAEEYVVGAGAAEGALAVDLVVVVLRGAVCVVVCVVVLGWLVARGAAAAVDFVVDDLAVVDVADDAVPAVGAAAGAICTTFLSSLGGGAARVAPAVEVGLKPQITLRSRVTRGTQVTFPSTPARI
ncbi:hypothetical protein [Shimia sp.]|uniref:hypothetical protein n=1 Tax=Shimia sp. TaxID=1954381 RepID=UPI00329856B2